jgi:uncharacterized protein YukE
MDRVGGALSEVPEIYTDYTSFNEKFDDITNRLYRNWDGRGAEAFEEDLVKIRQNTQSLYYQLKEFWDMLCDCHELIRITDGNIGLMCRDTKDELDFHTWIERMNPGPGGGSPSGSINQEVYERMRAFFDGPGRKHAPGIDIGGDGQTHCPELMAYFVHWVFGVPILNPTGHGKQVWQRVTDAFPDLFKSIGFYPGMHFQVGDIISTGGPYPQFGHVYLVTGFNPDTGMVTVIDQAAKEFGFSGLIESHDFHISQFSQAREGAMGSTEIYGIARLR